MYEDFSTEGWNKFEFNLKKKYFSYNVNISKYISQIYKKNLTENEKMI